MTNHENIIVVWRRKYIRFTGVVVFIGIFPLLLYPFSEYFGMQAEYQTWNHGPLYSYSGESGEMGLINTCIQYTLFFPSLFMGLLAFIFSLKEFLFGCFKNAFLYFLLIFLSLGLGLMQVFFLYWMFD
jgi:hypothetical protein